MRLRHGLVSGSFDPCTNGHKWLVMQALQHVDVVHIVIATNPNKKPLFTESERFDMLLELFEHQLMKVDVHVLPAKTMLIDYATEHGVDVIFRGLRNATDFEYEHAIDLVQTLRQPDIKTLYMMTPREFTEVSSSLVKSICGLTNWEDIVSRYVPDVVFDALRDKYSA